MLVAGAWLVLAAVLAAAVRAQEPTLVTVTSGPVQGFATDGVRTWLGIPYAAPPVGPLRWQPPQQPASWSAPRQCTAFGSECIQTPSGGGSEDCLTLNVYAPLNPVGIGPLPVAVWFHGGAFEVGVSSFYDLTRFVNASSAVICITANYRLGPLGFFAAPWNTSDSAPTPNFGLLDQQLVLRWVKANARAFGGDVGRVTIWGESAGGGSIEYHLVSPASDGLFNFAVVMSPFINSGLYGLDVARAMGLAVANSVGCSWSGVWPAPAQVEACMRATDPAMIAGAIGVNPSYFVGNAGQPGGWYPVIDGLTLPAPPMQLLASGQFNRKGLDSVVLGSTRDEGSFFLRTYAGTYALSNESYRLILNSTFGGTASTADPSAPLAPWAQAVDAFYTAQAAADPTEFGALFDRLRAALTDWQFTAPVRVMAAALRRAGVRAYAYLYAHAQAAADPRAGVSHSSDLAFDFDDPNLAFGVPFTAPEQALANAMVSAWTAFAASGAPHPQWPLYDADKDVLWVWNTTVSSSAADDAPPLIAGWRAAEVAFWEPYLPQ